jgi:hypothetical protein
MKRSIIHFSQTGKMQEQSDQTPKKSKAIQMKRVLLLMMSVCVMILGSSSVKAQKWEKVRGEGPAVKQDREGGTFNEIHTHGSFNLEVTDGASNSVTVEAQQNLQQYIEVENTGGELHIRNKKGYNIQPDREIIIYVTAPSLKGIYLSGSGNIKSTNQLNGSDKFDIKSSGSGNITIDIETADLKTSIAGSGNITLKGKTSDLDGKIAGSGNIRAKDLQSSNTSVQISGSGSAEVVATQKLNTNIAGSGDVKYWGDASVDSKVRGSGSVSRQK